MQTAVASAWEAPAVVGCQSLSLAVEGFRQASMLEFIVAA